MDILELIDDREQTVAESSPRPFCCPEQSCNKSFNRKSDLQRHHRIHTNERPYSCSFPNCGKSFIQRSALTVHTRTHTGEKPHSCEYIGCGKCFSDSSSLARHRRIHTGKRPYSCPIDKCGKSFCRKTTLTKHARKNHQLRTENDASDDDAEESEDDDLSPKASGKAGSRAQSKRSTKATARRAAPPSAPNRPSMLRTGSFAEPLTPHSPQSTVRSGHSSRNTSFSAASDSYPHSIPMAVTHSVHQHQPPTPQSPYYAEEDVGDAREISPNTMIQRDDEYSTTPTGPPPPSLQGNRSFDTLNIVCSTPTTHQLLAAQQTLQSSPGSLSSCSSATTASCGSDYFYRAPQGASSTHFQNMGQAISPGGIPPYPAQMPVQNGPSQHSIVMYSQNGQHQSNGMLSPHPQAPVQQQQQQPVWYDYPYQQQLLAAQTQPPQHRIYYTGVAAQGPSFIKAEPEQNLLPTPRGSFC
ncbi:hypothetical protein C7212DRAFT_185640 [Tuber magnatum]|uniref:C2H2-type domain-containing protein n=1 Tax=Tuber magnatum TaxID=42249 RepID=A0A317SRY1_9PEZI|nr:hypothetical protein C7212DRAFT_185640 [Tuber magnatum]